MKYAWIKRHKRLFPTAVMCKVLKVSTSGYYDSIKRQPSAQQVRRRFINACVVSFFGSLKSGWIKEKIYETFEDGKKDIFNYIEMFYNRKRRHKTLGYVSPVVYEEMYEMKQEWAA